MLDDVRRRRLGAMRGCERILSGVRPLTMRERLAELAAGDGLDGLPDFYGDGDGPVPVLEERVARLLGAEAAVFFPTGTMAQQVALRFAADRSGRAAVALHPLGHLEVHEQHAYAHLCGLRSVWPATAPRNPTAQEFAALAEPVAALVLELPLRDAGFVLPVWEELEAVSAAAREAGAWVHLDGARLWESVPFLGRPLEDIAALGDSTYVSFYKTLGGVSGAALAGPAELASFARLWRHRYGGRLPQQWPAALSALAGLDRELPRVGSYVRQAVVVAEALAGLPGVRVFPRPPHTHQFRVFFPFAADVLEEAALAMAVEERVWFAGGWRESDVPEIAWAEVTAAAPALEWTAADIIDTATRFLERAAALS